MPRISRRAALLSSVVALSSAALLCSSIVLLDPGSQHRLPAASDGLPAPTACASTKHTLKTLSARTPLPSVGNASPIGRPAQVGKALVAHYSFAPIGLAEHDCYLRQLHATFPTRPLLPLNLPGLVGAADVPGPAGACPARCTVAIALDYSGQSKILRITEAAYSRTAR
jgi:hypothetical protein